MEKLLPRRLFQTFLIAQLTGKNQELQSDYPDSSLANMNILKNPHDLLMPPKKVWFQAFDQALN